MKSLLVSAFLALALSAAAQTGGWQTTPLTDVRTGETFTLAEVGKPVYVETMATWCGNCRTQLQKVAEAKQQLGEDATFVALSVETNLSDEALKAYTEDEGFDFVFAVMSSEMLRALADDFGQSVLTPPATPHFIVYADGSQSELMTGFSEPDAIVAALSQ